ncbi:MAG: FAD-binding domain-containing protein [Marinicellaceae bacterium]
MHYKFPTDMPSISKRIKNINPNSYVKNRNFIDGSVTQLSPYISRGVISTKIVFDFLLEQSYDLNKIEKFIQELAWRDYWQQIWISKGELINQDLKTPQINVTNHKISHAFIDCQTGINAIDDALSAFYQTGYMHNHLRMYVASLVCNIAESHWKTPAKWMYYYLLDADWASNALSWQWVCGSNSHKKYIANQENINKYCYTKQSNTYLDVSYEKLSSCEVPLELNNFTDLKLQTKLPKSNIESIDSNKTTLIYNFYNLDPQWHKETDANRVLLLEPQIFQDYPISDLSVKFMLDLSLNINNIQIFVGSFEQLIKAYKLKNVTYKEHPLNSHYQGNMEPRDWIFNVSGYFPSFFKYWKECKKQLKSYIA